jgi:nucleoside-diphosphate-sugar epimerase
MGLCAVTGAAGYLGSRLSTYLGARGWRIRALSRRRVPADEWHAYSLNDDLPVDVLRGADALIHCAYDFRPISWPDIHRTNVVGSLRLFDAARAAGVRRMVFISTLSAYPGCRSKYGKAKLAIEERAAALGAMVVRPGLVYGQNAGGMVGALNKVMASAKVVPLIGDGSWKMYPAFDEDLCELVAKLCGAEEGRQMGPITAAASTPLSFRQLLQEMGRAHGRDPVFIPVPWRPVWLALASLEKAGFSPGFRSDSVLGLVYGNPAPSFGELQELGAQFRPFRAEALR